MHFNVTDSSVGRVGGTAGDRGLSVGHGRDPWGQGKHRRTKAFEVSRELCCKERGVAGMISVANPLDGG